MAGFTRPGRTLAAFAVGIALALVLGACGSTGGTKATGTTGAAPTASAATRFPLTITDDDGVSVTLPHVPRRIVTWGPSNTEILFALGIGQEVVGVSGPFDDYPAAASSIAQVGGKSGVEPDVEKVVSLHPDLVLNAFLGGDQWHQQLRSLGVPVFSVNATTFDDALHDIRTVGEVTGTAPAADRLASSMAAQAGAVTAKLAAAPRVSCFLEEGYPGIYTVGPGSIEFDLLRRAGCDPVTAGAKDAYPTWSAEQLVREDPSVYLVTSEAQVTPAQVAKRPGFDGIAAVKDGRVEAISSDLLNRPGPRVVQGLTDLARLLHPDLFA